MKLLVVFVAAVCLVSADKNLGRSPSAVVRVGKNGRQVVSASFANGPIRNGRRVVRRRQGQKGREARQQFHSFAPTFHNAAPLVHHAAPLLHHAPPPLVHQAQPVHFHQVQPVLHSVPLPVAHHSIFHHATPLALSEPVGAPTLEYGAPATVAPEVLVQIPLEPVIEAKEAPLAYSAPVEVKEAPLAYSAPVQVKEAPLAYSAPVQVKEVPLAYSAPVQVKEVPLAYSAPVQVKKVPLAYSAPVQVKEAPLAYSAPVQVKEAPLAYSAPVQVKEAPLAYSAPVQVKEVPLAYSAPVAVASETVEFIAPAVVQAKTPVVRSDPIAILRNINHPPAETANFDSDFETANGIQQNSVGTVRIVDDTEVTVMEGSYSYIGPNDVTYTVNWYADETGFHPSAPTGHFPKSVEPNHPEVAAAVRAQIAFAAEEDAAASSRSNSYAAPPPSYSAPLAYDAPQPAYQA